MLLQINSLTAQLADLSRNHSVKEEGEGLAEAAVTSEQVKGDGDRQNVEESERDSDRQSVELSERDSDRQSVEESVRDSDRQSVEESERDSDRQSVEESVRDGDRQSVGEPERESESERERKVTENLAGDMDRTAELTDTTAELTDLRARVEGAVQSAISDVIFYFHFPPSVPRYPYPTSYQPS